MTAPVRTRKVDHGKTEAGRGGNCASTRVDRQALMKGLNYDWEAADCPGGMDRREKGKRRRLIDPTTCERPYTDDDIDFMMAMDHYKRDNGRQFPTWSEVLEVLCALGYRRVAEQTRMPGLCTGMPPKVEA